MIKNSLLWKLEYEQMPTSYLFGTMHLKDEAAFKHHQKVLDVLPLCENFMTEIDIDKAKLEINASDYMMDLGLVDMLSAHKIERMDRAMQRAFNLSLHNFNRVYPVLTINHITESIMQSFHSVPLDVYLWEKAKALGLKLDGVERIQDHLKVLKNIPIEIQLKSLKDLLRDTRKFKKSLLRLMEIYKNEDIQELFRRTKKSIGGMRKVMLYDRNVLMANRIFDNKGASTTYAVGAAHLAGQKGVLNILKKKNFKLTAIR